MLRGRLIDRQMKDRPWDETTTVGREFGSPDFERLTREGTTH